MIYSEYEKRNAVKKKKWTSSELLGALNVPNIPNPSYKHNEHSMYKQPQRARYRPIADLHESIDWISRRNNNKNNNARHSLPNFSPISVQRVPSAKYGRTKSELSNDADPNSLSFISETTKNAVGVAAGFASSLWSSYGSKIVSKSIDSTLKAQKNINNINKTVQSVNYEDIVNKYVPKKITNVPIKSAVSKISENVSKIKENALNLKPLFDDDENIKSEPGDFAIYSPPKRLPFEKKIKAIPEQKKLKTMSPDNKERDDTSSSEETLDIFDDDKNSDVLSIATTTTTTTITYNVNISHFSIDDAVSSQPQSPIISNRSQSISSISTNTTNTTTSVITSNLAEFNNSNLSQFHLNIKQSFEHYYYYNNKIMTVQQHLISRIHELETMRINFLLCITKSFEYNLIECDVTTFNKTVPQFDCNVFIEFIDNNNLKQSQCLDNARLYYLNYLQTFIIHINNALITYNEYYINLNDKNKSKINRSHKMISNNLNIADRWNQFSRTVTSAMTTYAEDVKNLMGGQRRTLKSRMQFEYALGSKMVHTFPSVNLDLNCTSVWVYLKFLIFFSTSVFLNPNLHYFKTKSRFSDKSTH